MSATQSPLLSLLSWLTVSVFLFSGAPTPQQASGPELSLQGATLVNELARCVAAPGLPQSKGPAPLALLKLFALAGTSQRAAAPAPVFPPAGPLALRETEPLRARPPTLVGIIELRI